MNFVSVRIITSDVSRLVKFYEAITGLAAKRYTEDFAELATPACTLAIGSERTVALFGVGSARSADNHSCIVEFRVDDVDKEYARTRRRRQRVCPAADNHAMGKPLFAVS